LLLSALCSEEIGLGLLAIVVERLGIISKKGCDHFEETWDHLREGFDHFRRRVAITSEQLAIISKQAFHHGFAARCEAWLRLAVE
jgi:hypothetical protein